LIFTATLLDVQQFRETGKEIKLASSLVLKMETIANGPLIPFKIKKAWAGAQ